jgi:sugar phosphate isomerase/epimerase
MRSTSPQTLKPSYENFGLLADLSHFPLLNEKAAEAIPLIKDYLDAVHLGNCVCADRAHPAYGDIQPRFGVPGGEIDLPEVVDFFRVLDGIGFFDKPQRPVVSAEVRPVLAGEISDVVLANTKRVIRDAWALA